MRIFLLAVLMIVLGLNNISAFSPVAGNYRSAGTGNWSSLTSWQYATTATSWATPTSGQGYPGQFNSTAVVYIQSGHTITCDVGPTIATLNLSTGISSASTATSVLAAGTKILTVTGTINSFYAAVSTAAATNLTCTYQTTQPASITSGTGSVTFTGSAPTVTGQWSGLMTTTWTAIFTPSGLSAALGTDFQASTLTVSTSCTLTNANALTVPTLLTVTGALTNNGTVTAATALSGGGTFTNGATGTLNLGGTYGVTTLTASASGNIVNYTGGAQTIRAISYHHLGFSGGTKTISSATTYTVAGDWSVGSTASFSASSSVVNVTGNVTGSGAINMSSGGTVAVGGSWSNNGTFTAGSGTINYNGLAQTVAALAYNNLTLTAASSASKTLSASASISNILTISSSAVTFAISSPAVLTISGSSSHSIASSSNTTIANGATVTYSGSGSLGTSSGGNWSVSGLFDASYIGSSQNIPPNFTVNSNGELRLSGTSSKTINGSTTINGKISLQHNNTTGSSFGITFGAGSTLEYKGSGFSQTSSTVEWPSTGSSTYPTNVIINNSSGVTANPTSSSSRNIAGTLTLTAGVLTIPGSPTITFNGTSAQPIARGSGTLSLSSTSSLAFTPSTTPQVWTIPTGTFSSSQTFNVLTVTMGNTGTLTLPSDCPDLTISTHTNNSGLLVLGSGSLIVAAQGCCPSYSQTNMVVTSASSGYYKHTFSTTGSFTYPIGENLGNNEYSGFSFSLSSNSTSRTIGFRVADACAPNLGSPTYNISRYFSTTVSPSTGTYVYSVTLPYDYSTSTAGTCASPTTSDAVGGTISTVNSNIAVMGYSGSGTTWNAYQGSISSGLVLSSANQTTSPLGFDITGRQVDPPANDNCSGAIAFGALSQSCTNVTGNTLGASQSSAGCMGTADDDIWYSFVIPSGYTSVNFSTTINSGSSDLVLQFYSGSCASLSSVVCSDPESGTVTGLSAGTYYVRVYTYFSPISTVNSNFTLCLTLPAPPTIVLASSNPAVPAANINIASTKNQLFRFTTAVTVANTTINSVTFTTSGGTYAASDITKFQLWYYTSNTFSSASQIGSDITTGLGNGTHTFSGLTQAINNGTTGNFWITADVSSGATAGNTIIVPAITTGNLTFGTATSISGSTSAGGTQTIVAGPHCYTVPTFDFTLTPTSSWQTTGSTSITSSSECRIYKITMNTTNGYDFSACSADGVGSSATTGDADFYLYNSAGTQQWYIDGGGNCPSADASTVGSSYATWQPPSNGDYYLKVKDFSSGALTYNMAYKMTSAPANDDVCGAVALTANTAGSGTCTSSTNGDAALASQTFSYCGSSGISPARDVWFKFAATATSHTIKVTGNGTYDPIVQAYTATNCSTTVAAITTSTSPVSASSSCLDATGAGLTETLTISGMTVGSTYYVRVYHSSSAVPTNTTFTICLLTAPTNDEMCGAINITPVSGSCSGTTYDANLASQTFSYCGSSGISPARDVWFKFTATATSHTITVDGSASYDPIVQAYTAATCSTSIAAITTGTTPSASSSCLDATSAGGLETLTLSNLTVGIVYYFRVYHANSAIPATTTFDVCVLAPPANDEMCGAVALTANAAGSGTCTSSTSADANLASQTFSYCGSSGISPARDVWFKFVATATSHTIKVTGNGGSSTGYDPIVQAYTATNCSTSVAAVTTATSPVYASSSCLDATGAGATETLTLAGMTVGSTYYVRVYHSNSAIPTTTTFTVCLLTAPSNDEMCGAINITPVSGSCSGTTYDANLASQTFSYCGSSGIFPARDVWFKFTATATSHTITVDGSANYDPIVQAYTATTCSTGVAAITTGTTPSASSSCLDNTSAGALETMTLSNLTVGIVYYFRVYHSNSAIPSTTTFDVCVLAPPANDEMCGALALTANAAGSSTCSSTTSGDAALASQTFSYCGSFVSPVRDVWFKFTATAASHQVNVTGNGTFDPIVQAYTATNCSTSVAAITTATTPAASSSCLDATSAGSTETLTLTGLTVSTVYYVRVYHASSTVPSNTSFTVCLLTAPTNDDCSGAISATVTAPGASCSPTTYDAAIASKSSSPGTYASCDGNGTSSIRDVWFSFVATATTHMITVDGSASYTPVVQLFGGTCGSLGSALGCAIASSAGGVATLTQTGLNIGNTYRFRVYHSSFSSSPPATTTFALCILTPPTNDDVCGATTLTVNAATCSNTTGDVNVASQTFSACSGTANDDVWFKFVATGSGATIVVDGSASFDAVVQAYKATNCSTAVTAISTCCTPPYANTSCADGTLAGGIETLELTGLTAGTTYYVRVYDYYSGYPATTTFTICVIGPPANDDPCGAIALTVNSSNVCSSTTSGDVTAYSTQTYSGCTGTADDDVWYKFTATATSHNIKVTGSASFYPVVQAYTAANCSTLTAITTSTTPSASTNCAYSYSAGDSVDLQLSGLTNGTTYYVRVYNYYGSTPTTTTFTVCVQSPPANDECAGAVDIGTVSSTCTGTAGNVQLASQTFAHGSCDFASTARDVWYKFTTASSGAGSTSANIRVVCSNSFNAVVQAYSGTCGSLTAISGGCVNDWSSGNTETLHLVGLTASTTYYVRVYHGSSSIPNTTTFTICPLIPPDNDDCTGTALALNAGATSGTTVNASNTIYDYYDEFSFLNGYDDDDVWYNFTASGTNAVITLSGGSFDGVIDLRRVICPGVSIQYRDFGSSGYTETMKVTGLANGAQYGIRVFSWNYGVSAQGTFSIAVNNTGYTPGTYDNVGSAYVAGVGTNAPGASNASYGFEVGEPSGTNWGFDTYSNPIVASNSEWFVFTPSSTGSYSFSNSGGTFAMAIYSASSPASLLAGSYAEIGSTTGTSLSCLSLTAGTHYYIQITGQIDNRLNGFAYSGTPVVTITNNPPLGTPTFTSGPSSICLNATATYSATATNANSISYSIVGGGATINSSSGDVSNVTSTFTVRATATGNCGTSTADFSVSITTYNITSSANTGGSISPLGTNAYQCGSNQSYSITADPGYQIADVLVDGNSVGPVTTYSFNNIQTTHTISAVFVSGITVNVTMLIQGYYIGGGKMSAMRKLLGISGNSTHVDTVTIELHDSVNTSNVQVANGLLLTSSGTVSTLFTSALVSDHYYIVIKHRNSLETWSKYTFTGTPVVNYNFTTSADKAYGDNLIGMGDGKFAIYSGDINQDGTIDNADRTLLQSEFPNFHIGTHHQKDITGDGIVDDDDYRALLNSIGHSSQHP